MTTDPRVGSMTPDAAAAANNTAMAENRMRRRVVFASILGNGLEWFDFVSFGYFASIIAKVFFPAGSELALMLTAYVTVGIVAPIIVVLGRLVQGISIGGEFASATALLVEYAPANLNFHSMRSYHA